MEKQTFFVITYNCYGGVRDYFNGLKKSVWKDTYVIIEHKSYYVRKSFKKWKTLKSAEKWLGIIKEKTGKYFEDYECKIERI